MDKDRKTQIITEWGHDTTDTGSTEVQIALLSARISELTDHMRAHPKDHHTRRGLMRMVNRRRKLLRYLNSENHESYLAILQKLGIRR